MPAKAVTIQMQPIRTAATASDRIVTVWSAPNAVPTMPAKMRISPTMRCAAMAAGKTLLPSGRVTTGGKRCSFLKAIKTISDLL